MVQVAGFCSLCGGIFQSYSHVQPPTEPTHWSTEARIVHGPAPFGDNDVAWVTGLGLDSASELMAPPDYEESYTTYASIQSLEIRRMRSLEPGLKNFPLHEYCWQLLLYRCSATVNQQFGPKQLAQSLFRVLYSMPWTSHDILIPDHRYHGAMELRQTENGASLLKGDPNQTISPPSTELLAEQTTSCQTQDVNEHMVQAEPELDAFDPFTNLPLEIVWKILEYLPSVDVCTARLSSRCLARIGSPSRLPQSFWASRFNLNREMGFVLPQSSHNAGQSSIDWSRWYQQCKEDLGSRPKTSGFHNRRRIWRCINDFATVLIMLLSFPKEEGGGTNTEQSEDLAARLGSKVSCPDLASESDASVKCGVRSYSTSSVLELGEGTSHYTVLSFCVMSLSCGTYISGVRVVIQSPDYTQKRVQAAGRIDSTKLHSISLGPGDKLIGVDTHLSSYGIHALNFRVRKRDGMLFNYLIGDDFGGENIMGVSRLRSRCHVTGLVFTFDLFKVVAIQILDTSTVQSLDTVRSIVWNPDPPTTDMTGDSPPSECRFPVYLYIPFGGIDGSRLASLCRVTALLHGTDGFFGFIFAYTNGEEILYGKRNKITSLGNLCSCVEQSFLIDGPRGELITHFAAPTEGCLPPEARQVQDIEVRTNFGRKYVFGAFSSRRPEPQPEEHREISCQQPVQQTYVASMIIRISAPWWCFESIKSHTMPVTAPMPRRGVSTSVPPSISTEMLHAGFWMLRHQGSCFTVASLEGVRRVRVSAGSESRSRSEHQVTGLYLEYYNGMGDAIVGQWMNEVGSFTLRKGEYLTHVSFWCDIELHFYNPIKLVGNVIGVGLQTSSRRSFEVRFATSTARTELHHRANPYEKLASICWAFNSSTDDIQVRLKATPKLDRGALSVRQTSTTWQTLDLAYGITRIKPDPEDHVDRKLWAINTKPIRYSWRYLCHRQTYFFEELDRFGNGIPLTSIELFVHPTNQLAGMFFHYHEDVVIRQGARTDLSERLDFRSPQEKISHLLVYVHQDKDIGLELHTNRGRQIRAGPQDDADIIHVSCYQLIPGAPFPWHGLLALCRAHIQIHEFPEHDTDGKTIKCAVGIVSVRRRNRDDLNYNFTDIGPVYLSGL